MDVDGIGIGVVLSSDGRDEITVAVVAGVVVRVVVVVIVVMMLMMVVIVIVIVIMIVIMVVVFVVVFMVIVIVMVMVMVVVVFMLMMVVIMQMSMHHRDLRELGHRRSIVALLKGLYMRLFKLRTHNPSQQTYLNSNILNINGFE